MLRILPLRGGSDAMTELVLISSEHGVGETHAAHVAGARSQLDSVIKAAGDALAPPRDPPDPT